MKNFIVVLLLTLPMLVFSQTGDVLAPDLSIEDSKSSEISLFIGLSAYEGDLHCFEDENLTATTNSKAAFGIKYNRNFNKKIAGSVSYINTKLKGDDNKFTEESGHTRRGFKFENTLHEVSVRADYTPLGHKDLKVQPYIFAGVGLAFGGADTNYNNDVDNPVSDELIRDDMENGKNTSFAAPIGFGLKAALSPKITIGLEAGLRVFTNDYLDGVSKSANSEVNDYYGMGGVTISYRL